MAIYHIDNRISFHLKSNNNYSACSSAEA